MENARVLRLGHLLGSELTNVLPVQTAALIQLREEQSQVKMRLPTDILFVHADLDWNEAQLAYFKHVLQAEDTQILRLQLFLELAGTYTETLGLLQDWDGYSLATLAQFEQQGVLENMPSGDKRYLDILSDLMDEFGAEGNPIGRIQYLLYICNARKKALEREIKNAEENIRLAKEKIKPYRALFDEIKSFQEKINEIRDMAVPTLDTVERNRLWTILTTHRLSDKDLSLLAHCKLRSSFLRLFELEKAYNRIQELRKGAAEDLCPVLTCEEDELAEMLSVESENS